MRPSPVLLVAALGVAATAVAGASAQAAAPPPNVSSCTMSAAGAAPTTVRLDARGGTAGQSYRLRLTRPDGTTATLSIVQVDATGALWATWDAASTGSYSGAVMGVSSGRTYASCATTVR